MKRINFFETSPEQLSELINEGIRTELEAFKKNFHSKAAQDELLTRDQACEFLQINSSTLWAWTNQNKVTAYGIGNRRYYKRSELLNCLTELKK